MLAYKVAMFLIIFSLALPAVQALGIFPNVPNPESIVPAGSDWIGMVGTAAGLLGLLVGFVLHVPVGALVFAGIFTLSSIPLGSTLTLMTTYGMSTGIMLLLEGALSFVFVFAFIQLASSPVGE